MAKRRKPVSEKARNYIGKEHKNHEDMGVCAYAKHLNEETEHAEKLKELGVDEVTRSMVTTSVPKFRELRRKHDDAYQKKGGSPGRRYNGDKLGKLVKKTDDNYQSRMRDIGYQNALAEVNEIWTSMSGLAAASPKKAAREVKKTGLALVKASKKLEKPKTAHDLDIARDVYAGEETVNAVLRTIDSYSINRTLKEILKLGTEEKMKEMGELEEPAEIREQFLYTLNDVSAALASSSKVKRPAKKEKEKAGPKEQKSGKSDALLEAFGDGWKDNEELRKKMNASRHKVAGMVAALRRKDKLEKVMIGGKAVYALKGTKMDEETREHYTGKFGVETEEPQYKEPEPEVPERPRKRLEYEERRDLEVDRSYITRVAQEVNREAKSGEGNTSILMKIMKNADGVIDSTEVAEIVRMLGGDEKKVSVYQATLGILYKKSKIGSEKIGRRRIYWLEDEGLDKKKAVDVYEGRHVDPVIEAIVVENRKMGMNVTSKDLLKDVKKYNIKMATKLDNRSIGRSIERLMKGRKIKMGKKGALLPKGAEYPPVNYTLIKQIYDALVNLKAEGKTAWAKAIAQEMNVQDERTVKHDLTSMVEDDFHEMEVMDHPSGKIYALPGEEPAEPRMNFEDEHDLALESLGGEVVDRRKIEAVLKYVGSGRMVIKKENLHSKWNGMEISLNSETVRGLVKDLNDEYGEYKGDLYVFKPADAKEPAVLVEKKKR